MRRCRYQTRNLRGAGGRRSRLLRRTRRFPGTVRVAQQALPGAAVEHRLDVLPGVDYLVRLSAGQLHVPAPRVEVGRVRLHVLVRRAHAMRVEDELVRREEQAAVRALDALGARAVVPSRQEGATTTPGALVMHGEREVLRQSALTNYFRTTDRSKKSNDKSLTHPNSLNLPGRRVVAEKGFTETFRLSSCDHAAPARGHRHRAGTTKYLELDRRALHAGDAQRHSTIVNLVVAELLEQSVADLRQTQSFLTLDH